MPANILNKSKTNLQRRQIEKMSAVSAVLEAEVIWNTSIEALKLRQAGPMSWRTETYFGWECAFSL